MLMMMERTLTGYCNIILNATTTFSKSKVYLESSGCDDIKHDHLYLLLPLNICETYNQNQREYVITIAAQIKSYPSVRTPAITIAWIW